MKIKMTIEQAVEQLDSLSRERKHKIQVNDGIAVSLVLRELNRLREQLRQHCCCAEVELVKFASAALGGE
jgi:hypothetical protein